MDAESTYVRPGSGKKAGMPASDGSKGNFDYLISEVREAEARIITNIKEIQDKFAADNIGKHLISAILEGLFERIETMNTQSIGEVSGKAVTNVVKAVKSHPGSTALAGLGIGSLIVRNMMKQRAAGSKIMAPPKQTEQDAQSKPSHAAENIQHTDEAAARKPGSAMEGISSYMDENPLLVGLMGLSAGLVLGILTSGMGEGIELLDETRRTIKEKTREILNETREKAGHVIEAARHAAREEAERQNLM